MLGFFLAGVLSIALTALLSGLIRRAGAYSLPELLYRMGSGWGKLCDAVLLTVLFLGAASTLLGFSYFLALTVYPGRSMLLYLAAMAGCAAYGAYKGIEGLARFAFAVSLLVLLAVGAVVLVLLPEVEPVYFTPPLAGGAQPAMQSFFQALLYNLEIPVFLVFQGNIRGRSSGSFARGMLLSMSVYQLVVFFTAVTLGPFARLQRFPIYAMIASAQFSVLRRLDMVHLTLWIVLAFLRCCVYLYCAAGCLQRLLPPRQEQSRGKIALVLGASVFGMAVFLQQNLVRSTAVWQFLGTGIPLFLVVLMTAGTAAGVVWKQGGQAE